MVAILLQRVTPGEGVDEADLLALDAALQAHAHLAWSGLRRRTVARGEGGWLVVSLFSRREDAEAALADSSDPAARWRAATEALGAPEIAETLD